jgi:hypothetical protein
MDSSLTDKSNRHNHLPNKTIVMQVIFFSEWIVASNILAFNLSLALLHGVTSPTTPHSSQGFSAVVLLEKLIVAFLVKKCATFYGPRRFITAFTRAHHRTVS